MSFPALQQCKPANRSPLEEIWDQRQREKIPGLCKQQKGEKNESKGEGEAVGRKIKIKSEKDKGAIEEPKPEEVEVDSIDVGTFEGSKNVGLL